MRDLQNYLADVRARITAHGWMVQSVSSSDVSPPFLYTVGLFPIAGFEIVGFGLDPFEGSVVLNDLAERVQRGTRFANGETLCDVLDGGYAVTLLEVPDAGVWLRIACLLYGSDGTALPAWQLIVPDAAHRLPWDPDYTGPVQPLLAPPPV